MGFFSKIGHFFKKAAHDTVKFITHPKADIKKIADLIKHPGNIIKDVQNVGKKITGSGIPGISGIGGGLFGEITSEFGGEIKEIAEAGADTLKEGVQLMKSSEEIVESVAHNLPKFITEIENMVFKEGSKLLGAFINLVNLIVKFLEYTLSGLDYIIEPAHIKYTAVVILLAFLYMYRYKQ